MIKKQSQKNGRFLQVDVLTLFPEMIDAYCGESILGRAQKNKLLKVEAHQLRQWAIDQHGHVDDRPFGGGAGMVMRVEPFYEALKTMGVARGVVARTTTPRRTSQLSRVSDGKNVGRRTSDAGRVRVILTSAKGKMFTQSDARRLAKYDRLVFLCGRYEGVDERVAKKLTDEELSIGPYVMTGGELAALVMTDAVARLRPGVLGAAESLDQESWNEDGKMEYAQYTRPEEFMGWKVPKVLLSGDHKKIAEWRGKVENSN